MCKALGAPAAPPHVFAGVSSILTLPAPNEGAKTGEKPPIDQVNVSALAIVVYLLVRTRLSGAPMPAEGFVRQRRLAIEAIQDSSIKEAVAEVSEEADVFARITSWGRKSAQTAGLGWIGLQMFLKEVAWNSAPGA